MADPKPLVGATFRRANELLHETGMGEGCWESPRTPAVVYPTVWHNGRHVKISRYVWSAFFGQVSTNLIIRHRCDNPRCIRPAHLIPGTTRDNTLDSVKRGRYNNQNTVKVRCIRGHEPNWHVVPGEGRRCLECKRITDREGKRRRASANR